MCDDSGERAEVDRVHLPRSDHGGAKAGPPLLRRASLLREGEALDGDGRRGSIRTASVDPIRVVYVAFFPSVAPLAMFVRPSITAQMIRFIRGNYREFCRNQ
jgi:hypothetical protein